MFKLLALVDPRNTSQMCSGCGSLVPKQMFVRLHRCPACELVLDRDVNASRNIPKRGLEIGLELTESKPVETLPLPLKTSVWYVGSMNQEAQRYRGG